MLYSRHHSRAGTGLIVAGLLALCCSDQAGQAQNPGGAPQVAAQPRRGATHDSISEQELQKRASGTTSMDVLIAKNTTPLGDVRPSRESSLLTSSLFLFDGAMFTVVPVGAILNLPPAHRHRVVAKPEGSFTFWPNFLKRNASWLAAREVSLKMAKGDAESAKAVLRDTSTDARVIVSVYKGGPITILEAPPEAAKTTKSAPANPDAAAQREAKP